MILHMIFKGRKRGVRLIHEGGLYNVIYGIYILADRRYMLIIDLFS